MEINTILGLLLSEVLHRYILCACVINPIVTSNINRRGAFSSDSPWEDRKSGGPVAHLIAQLSAWHTFYSAHHRVALDFFGEVEKPPANSDLKPFSKALTPLGVLQDHQHL